MSTGVTLTLVSVAVLLLAEYNGWTRLRWFSKPLASTGFLIAAVEWGATESTYGLAVLIALILGWLGDVLLLPSNKTIFLAGIIAFFLGHLVYAVGFAVLGLSWPLTLATGCVIGTTSALIGWRLLPQVPTKLKGPVIAYIIVLTAMVAMAVGAAVQHQNALLLVGSVAFLLSDMAVARHRFVTKHWINKLIGGPLYFGGQLMLASTVTLTI